MSGNTEAWIKIKDKLPEKSGRYLVIKGIGERHIVPDENPSIEWFDSAYPLWWENADCPITHWMPLPLISKE